MAANDADNNRLLQVSDLRTGFVAGRRVLTAVDGIGFEVAPGETFALLGESGCGKSAAALSLLRLLPAAGRILGGEVRFDGVDLMRLSEAEMRAVRGGGMAMIFQEPATSLNPVLTVGRQIGEVLEKHSSAAPEQVASRAIGLLRAVGIADPERRLSDYPFQLSGGMKQRVMIAMALAGEPRLLVADEPTTALDVTIQAQILELLQQLQAERGMGMLLITHDLGVVARMAHRVGVMYAGQIVEEAPREVFFEGDFGAGVKGEAVIATPGLALGARKRVFLFRLGVQEDGEILAHGQEAALEHLFGRGADHDPVAVAHRPSEEFVAHGSADAVDLHPCRARMRQRT